LRVKGLGFGVRGLGFGVRGLGFTRQSKVKVGGVNHCRSHCRLAKFRGLIYGGKYSAVIGSKVPIAWKIILRTNKQKNVFRPITAQYFP
jgi:hypothetical protein